jgi:hypothetical protein
MGGKGVWKCGSNAEYVRKIARDVPGGGEKMKDERSAKTKTPPASC